MLLFFVRLSLPSCLLLAAAVAAAQPAGSQVATGAAPATGGLAYVSVFENYRGWQELSVASWAEGNRTVGETAGAPGHAMHTQTPAQASQGAQMPSAAPAHHHGHGVSP